MVFKCRKLIEKQGSMIYRNGDPELHCNIKR